MSPGVSIGVSVVLLGLNAFFVTAEFAIVSAKRHRLEIVAAYGSRAARAAVRNSHQLSLGLAGAQLGITAATLGLGALAKPAVADLLQPLFGAMPVSETVATALATVLAVVVVVFLHMVVGEMAPKSWAISHPERSALLVALPFRGFVKATRWVLGVLNAHANALVRRCGVEPVGEGGAAASVNGPVDRSLLTTSREHGLIEPGAERLLGNVLALANTPVYAVTLPLADAVTVPVAADAADVERLSLASGRSRLVVVGETRAPAGLVHVRDAVLAHPRTVVAELAYDAVRLDQHDSLMAALVRMRDHQAQLSFVTGSSGEVVGIAALEDILERVLGDFDDETDVHQRGQ